MKNALMINFETKAIVMTSSFAKNCRDTASDEYAQLQRVRADYPEYAVTTRQIKKNPYMERYRGLTYEFMETYIWSHEPKENVKKTLDEFDEMRLITNCHSKAFRYPIIKKWFLEKYPEIVMLGRDEKEAM